MLGEFSFFYLSNTKLSDTTTNHIKFRLNAHDIFSIILNNYEVHTLVSNNNYYHDKKLSITCFVYINVRKIHSTQLLYIVWLFFGRGDTYWGRDIGELKPVKVTQY